MSSIWAQGVELPRFGPPEGDLRADVLVIGGGLAGILCAWRLAQDGVDCVLVEADRLCGGVTQNTTAKITAQHGLIYHKLTEKLGPERARLYLEANLAALEEYRGLCREIDCDFEEKDSFVYAVNGLRQIDRELAALDRLGFPAEFAAELPLPIPTAGAVRFPNQAQFHPLKFAAALVRNLRIFEGARVLELSPGTAVTGHGKIRAEKTVIATHFPMLNKHGSYFLKLYQSRSYVLALDNAPDVGGMYVDEDEKGLSFRNAGGRLLLGGGGHRTGKRGGGWKGLESIARAHWPESRPAARWAAQDCVSLDGAPYVGRYSKRTHDLYVVTGFNKWGMTSAMAASAVLADLVQGRENPYAAAFDPSRTVLRPQLAVNGWEAALGLLTPAVPRCPHMGCALKYNAQEHSWDCSCHGSRFGENGRLLDNPANGDLRT